MSPGRLRKRVHWRGWNAYRTKAKNQGLDADTVAKEGSRGAALALEVAGLAPANAVAYDEVN